MFEAYFIGSISEHVLSAAHFIGSAICFQCALSAVKVTPSLEAGATLVLHCLNLTLFTAVTRNMDLFLASEFLESSSSSSEDEILLLVANTKNVKPKIMNYVDTIHLKTDDQVIIFDFSRLYFYFYFAIV